MRIQVFTAHPRVIEVKVEIIEMAMVGDRSQRLEGEEQLAMLQAKSAQCKLRGVDPGSINWKKKSSRSPSGFQVEHPPCLSTRGFLFVGGHHS